MEKYAKEILVAVVAQICQTVGWQSINQSAYDILVDIAHRYLKEMCRKAHAYCELYNTTEPTIEHIQLMMADMKINVNELKEYIEWIDPITFPVNVPTKLPVRSESHLQFLKPGSKEMLTRPVNIPEYLPPMYPEIEETPDVQMKTEDSDENRISSNDESIIDIQGDGVFKHPSDILNSKPKVLEDDNYTLREVKSVIMTSSGFLSSSREGCLPESKIPLIAIDPPKPPKPPKAVPAVQPHSKSHSKKAVVDKHSDKNSKNMNELYHAKKRDNNNSILSHNKNTKELEKVDYYNKYYHDKLMRKLARKQQKELKHRGISGIDGKHREISGVDEKGKIRKSYKRKNLLSNLDLTVENAVNHANANVKRHKSKSNFNSLILDQFNDVSVIKQPYKKSSSQRMKLQSQQPDIVIEIEDQNNAKSKQMDSSQKLNIFKKVSKNKDTPPNKYDNGVIQRLKYDSMNSMAVNDLRNLNEIDIIPVQDAFPKQDSYRKPQQPSVIVEKIDEKNANVEIIRDDPFSIIEIVKHEPLGFDDVKPFDRFPDSRKSENMSVERCLNFSPEKLLQQRLPDATIHRILNEPPIKEPKYSDVFIDRVPERISPSKLADSKAQRHQAAIQRLSETVIKRSVESSIQKLPNTTIIKRLNDNLLQQLPGTSTSIKRVIPENISIQRVPDLKKNVKIDRLPSFFDDKSATIQRLSDATIERIPPNFPPSSSMSFLPSGSMNFAPSGPINSSPPEISVEQAAAQFLSESTVGRKRQYNKSPFRLKNTLLSQHEKKGRNLFDNMNPNNVLPGTTKQKKHSNNELTPLQLQLKPNKEKVKKERKKHKNAINPPIELPPFHYKPPIDDEITVISDDEIDINSKPKTPEYKPPEYKPPEYKEYKPPDYTEYKPPDVKEYKPPDLREYQSSGFKEYKSPDFKEYKSPGFKEYKSPDFKEYKPRLPSPSFFPMFPSLPAGPGLIPQTNNPLPLFNFPLPTKVNKKHTFGQLGPMNPAMNPDPWVSDLRSHHVPNNMLASMNNALTMRSKAAKIEDVSMVEPKRENHSSSDLSSVVETPLKVHHRKEKKDKIDKLDKLKRREEKREKKKKRLEQKLVMQAEQDKHKTKKIKKDKRNKEHHHRHNKPAVEVEPVKPEPKVPVDYTPVESTVPKLTLKLQSTRSPTPDKIPTKITIKAIREPSEGKRDGSPYVVRTPKEPSPELAKISPLFSRPPKVSKKSKTSDSSKPLFHDGGVQDDSGVLGDKIHSHHKSNHHKKKDKSKSSSKDHGSSSKTVVEETPQPAIPKLIIPNISTSSQVPVAPAPSKMANPVSSKPVGYIIDTDGNKVWICPACGGCDDGSAMIGCDACDAWYHWTCVGIFVPPDDNVNWYCKLCLLNKNQSTNKKKKRKKKKSKDGRDSP